MSTHSPIYPEPMEQLTDQMKHMAVSSADTQQQLESAKENTPANAQAPLAPQPAEGGGGGGEQTTLTPAQNQPGGTANGTAVPAPLASPTEGGEDTKRRSGKKGRKNGGNKRGKNGAAHQQQHHQQPHPHSHPHPHQQHHMAAMQHDRRTSINNLYLPALAPNTSDADLVNMCSHYGVIVSAKAIVDRITGLCKGYGFVMFEDPSAAQVALQGLIARGQPAAFAKIPQSKRTMSHGGPYGMPVSPTMVLPGGQMLPAPGYTPPSRYDPDPTNLYFSNLPVALTEEDMLHMLGPYGTVVSCRILRDYNGLSRGVGFARMEDKQICERIIEAFNGRLLPGGADSLQVKFADTPSARRKGKKSANWATPVHAMAAPMPPGGHFDPAAVHPAHFGAVPMPMYVGGHGAMMPPPHAAPHSAFHPQSPVEAPSSPMSLGGGNVYMPVPPPFHLYGGPAPGYHAPLVAAGPQALGLAPAGLQHSPTFSGHMPMMPVHPFGEHPHQLSHAPQRQQQPPQPQPQVVDAQALGQPPVQPPPPQADVSQAPAAAPAQPVASE